MTQETRKPRRPAILTANQSEAIIGEEDPAAISAIAHASAWALMGVGDEDYDDKVIARIRALAKDERIDTLAHVWSRSPEKTLPGALWRIYLLSQWYHRDPDALERRYAEGVRSEIRDESDERSGSLSLSDVIHEIDALLGGERTDDDMESILTDASRVMLLLAAEPHLGAAWIVTATDPLAHPVTIRSAALIKTAREVYTAAQEAKVGTLE